MTKTMTLVTRMLSDTLANDANIVVQPPKVQIPQTTLWRFTQSHTVPASSKVYRYPILTVPPTTPAGFLALTGAVGVYNCAAVSNSPPKGVGR